MPSFPTYPRVGFDGHPILCNESVAQKHPVAHVMNGGVLPYVYSRTPALTLNGGVWTASETIQAATRTETRGWSVASSGRYYRATLIAAVTNVTATHTGPLIVQHTAVIGLPCRQRGGTWSCGASLTVNSSTRPITYTKIEAKIDTICNGQSAPVQIVNADDTGSGYIERAYVTRRAFGWYYQKFSLGFTFTASTGAATTGDTLTITGYFELSTS